MKAAVTEVGHYPRDVPDGCLCHWDPVTGIVRERRVITGWRIAEIQPLCPVHGTEQARKDALKALDGAVDAARKACCGQELEMRFGSSHFGCPSCGRGYRMEDLFRPEDNPFRLPSQRRAAAASPDPGASPVPPAIAAEAPQHLEEVTADGCHL